MAVRSVQESFLGTVGEVSKLDTILTRLFLQESVFITDKF